MAVGFCCCWMWGCVFTLSWICVVLFKHSYIHIFGNTVCIKCQALWNSTGIKSHSTCSPIFWFIDFYGPCPDGTSILRSQNTYRPYLSNKHLLDTYCVLDLWDRKTSNAKISASKGVGQTGGEMPCALGFRGVGETEESVSVRAKVQGKVPRGAVTG